MNELTGSQRDAASVIFNLPDYRVLHASDLPDGGWEVLIESIFPPGCPQCGLVAERVHSRRWQRVRDVPLAGATTVVWAKRRWFCDEDSCPRGTFWEATTRLRTTLVEAVVDSARAASEVARAHGVSWWLVQASLTVAVALLPTANEILVTRLGIDEHRYRSVRGFRGEDGAWKRFEPLMTTMVDLDTGRVLGVVDGRDSAAVATWLKARTPAWRQRVRIVAIDPSAAFRKALRDHLPQAEISVDKFHLVKLANDMVTHVRQRRAREDKGRRGRQIDPSWANRTLLLRGADTLRARLGASGAGLPAR